MERPPRDMKRDRLASWPVIRYAYLYAGMWESFLCLIAYLIVFWQHDINISKYVAFAGGNKFQPQAVNNRSFVTNTGQVITADDQVRLLGQAQAGEPPPQRERQAHAARDSCPLTLRSVLARSVVADAHHVPVLAHLDLQDAVRAHRAQGCPRALQKHHHLVRARHRVRHHHPHRVCAGPAGPLRDLPAPRGRLGRPLRFPSLHAAAHW